MGNGKAEVLAEHLQRSSVREGEDREVKDGSSARCQREQWAGDGGEITKVLADHKTF